MINSAASNNSLMTNFDQAQSINMPSKFTSAEANFFKEMFQKKDSEIQSINNKSTASIKPRMIFDFETTNFIDQGGIAGLCQIIRIAKERKIDLIFSRFSPEVRIVLSLLGLEEVFPIAE